SQTKNTAPLEPSCQGAMPGISTICLSNHLVTNHQIRLHRPSQRLNRTNRQLHSARRLMLDNGRAGSETVGGPFVACCSSTLVQVREVLHGWVVPVDAV